MTSTSAHSHVRPVLAAACGAALLGLPSCGGGGSGGLVLETFRNPPQLSSQGGELSVKLDVVTERIEAAGKLVTTTVYNGQYVPPVLRLKPGDTLRLELNNKSAMQTNEHYHGLNVSPRINSDATVSDNVFVHVDPGMKLDYRVAIPATHNPGLYWYHSHLHGSSEQQVMGGLSGGMVIEGLLDPLPEFAGITERVMLLKDIQITPEGRVPDDIDSSAPTNRTVNGQTNPTMVIAPGETQLLRIGNISANMYYRLQLPGHVLYEMARDGNRHNQLVPFDELLLPPASRSEVLIQGGPPGRYELKTLALETGPQGDTAPETTLLTVVSQGPPRTPIALPAALPTVEDFRNLAVARQRTITFEESEDGNTFYIDSGDGPKQFDPNRIDSTIVAGTVEEWTILNPTGEWHVFHIHQTDFQVTEINGVPQPFVGHQDNVNVAFQPDDASPPGQVKVLIDFRNPLTIGKFVYHCHILEHEDGGMMAVAEVVAPSQMAAQSKRSSKPAQRPAGVLDRALAEADLRSEATLAAVQAGSYCQADRGADRSKQLSARTRLLSEPLLQSYVRRDDAPTISYSPSMRSSLR